MLDTLRRDFRVVFERDPAATNRLEVVLTYAGFQAIVSHRIAHRLREWKIPVIPRLIATLARWFTGIEIHPAARIGSGFFIDHGMGVVIGETSEIGDDVTLFQGVTLGGTGKERGKRHPTLGNHVVVGAGAKVLGAITIGDHVKIGANSVVLRSVPPHATVVGVPGKIIKAASEEAPEVQMDHANIPDPIAERLEAQERMILDLKKRLDEALGERLQKPKEGDG
ncbi:MAG TPA: serine O-acetyltransferase [Nitrospiria bacterium]|nr:serine O-acetyltransferase [Nitrospiria bacterium]